MSQRERDPVLGLPFCCTRPSNEKLYPDRKGCVLPPIRPATLSPWLPPWLLRLWLWLRLPPVLWLWLPPTLLWIRLPTRLPLALLEPSAPRLAEARQSCEREAGLRCIGSVRLHKPQPTHGLQECGRFRIANPTPLADGKFSQQFAEHCRLAGQRLTYSVHAKHRKT